MFRRISLFLVVLVSGTGTLRAEVGMLDLLPTKSGVALSVRNLEELQKKGDKLLTQINAKVTMRPSQLFQFAYQFLNVQGEVDEKRPSAILLASPEIALGKQQIGLDDLDKLIVVVMPFKTKEGVAKRFGIKPEDLKEKKLVPAKPRNQIGDFGKLVYLRGKHLIFGNLDKAILSVAEGKPLSQSLSKERQKTFGNADILVHVGAKEWGKDWAGFLKEIEREATRGAPDADKKVIEQFVQSLSSVDYGLAAFHIDNGIGFNFLSVFQESMTKEAKDFLSALKGGSGSSHLRGLPEGEVVAAQAIKTDGSKNAIIARAFLDFLLQYFVQTKQILSASDRPNYLGVFGEIWQHLRGNRVAVYRTKDEQELGLFSMLAVLDTEDPGAFLQELKGLSRMVIGTAADLKDEKKKKATEEDIQKLIEQLGSRRYQLRESASLKLSLIGEPVLPYLKKVLESKPDLETRRRAQRIRDQIVEVVKVRREELLQKVPAPVRPTFAFVPKGEKRGSHSVDVVRMRLANEDKLLTQNFERLLGPEWSRIRLVTQGKHVVVLFGSDLNLLDQALANLKDNKPGLAASTSLKAFQKHSEKAQKVEFHVSMQRFMGLLSGEDLKKKSVVKEGEELTSFSLTIDLDRIRFDVWLPIAELRKVAKNNFWW